MTGEHMTEVLRWVASSSNKLSLSFFYFVMFLVPSRWLLTFVSAVGLFLPLADQLYLSQFLGYWLLRRCKHCRN